MNSSLLDSKIAKIGDKVPKMKPAYVIFITENDVLGGGCPMYHIEENLPYIKGDTELEEVVIDTVEKMKRMPDREFAKLDLEAYKQEPEDE